MTLAEARRISLAALGLSRPQPSRPDARHMAAAVRRLGVLQLDSVNVVLRAQYMVLYSRLGPYDLAAFERVFYHSRQFTEQWAHEASIVPVETWPLLAHRRQAFRIRPSRFEPFLARHPEYVEQVLQAVRDRGPLNAADLPAPEGVPRKAEGTWMGTVPRGVLEALFARGRVAVASRGPDFARSFDLPERLIPAAQLARSLDIADQHRELIRMAARAYGIATLDDLADYWRMPVAEVRPRVTELVASGELETVQVESWRVPAYLHAEARRPRAVETSRLLSPFDPAVWYRRRLERLFQFEYRLEIFVPKPQRRWGYYVLPFLLGDRLVARVDLRADRRAGRLEVLSTHYESDVRKNDVKGPLEAELRKLEEWLL